MLLGDIRGGVSENYIISKIGKKRGFEYIGRRYDIGECPKGFKFMGGFGKQHGLWTCVNNELVNQDFFTFYIGDVVNHQGDYYELTEEGLAKFGQRGWHFCNEGKEVAIEFYKDGFWVCRGDF